MHYLSYPAAEATHQQVCDDFSLFKVTLDGLLTAMGVKLKIPKVGGQEVDLHRLYIEVTTLGGLEMVVGRKQWVIVCEPFNFPPSFTNKSFVMKKLYTNALHHYEQVYFHRNLGPIIPTPSSSGDSPVFIGSDPSDRLKRKHSSHDGSMWGSSYPPQSGPTTGFFRQYQSGGQGYQASSMDLAPGTRFSGTVESSFENGYYLTLELSNGERVQGLMYRRPSSQAMQYKMESAVVTGGATSEHRCADSATVPGVECNSSRLQQRAVAGSGGGGGLVSSGVAGCKRLKTGMVGAPTQPRSALYFFASSITPEEVRAVHPEDDLTQATVRVAAEWWNELLMEDKQPFLDEASADLARYKAESASLSQTVASGSSLHPNPRDSKASAQGLEGHNNVPAQQCEEPASKQLSQRQHSQYHAQHSNQGGAKQSYTLPSPRVSTPSSPHHPMVKPLPSSHPTTTSLGAAHARAVAAAIAAGAPPPPSLHMLGIPIAPHGTPAMQQHRDELRLHDGAGNGYDHNPHVPNPHAPYYSSESDHCQGYEAEDYHPEGNSSGPRPAAEKAHYSEQGALQGAGATHNYDEDTTFDPEGMQEDRDQRQGGRGQGHGREGPKVGGGGYRGSAHPCKDTDHAFACMLGTGPFMERGGDGVALLQVMEPGPARSNKRGTAPMMGVPGSGVHHDSPLSDQEERSPESYYATELTGLGEGYPSSILAMGAGDGYSCEV